MSSLSLPGSFSWAHALDLLISWSIDPEDHVSLGQSFCTCRVPLVCFAFVVLPTYDALIHGLFVRCISSKVNQAFIRNNSPERRILTHSLISSSLLPQRVILSWSHEGYDEVVAIDNGRTSWFQCLRGEINETVLRQLRWLSRHYRIISTLRYQGANQ